MASNIREARYTLRDIWLYTHRMYKNRFEYRERDVLKSIQIREVKTYTKDRKITPIKKYEIITSSYPQYRPYADIKGKKSKKQRKVKHQYDIIFQFSELNWHSPFKWRVGSQRKYPDDSQINWNQVKSLHSTVKRRLEKRYGKGTPEYKKALEKHKRKAKYLDKGDYVSQVYGINGDFYFRQAPRAYVSGNLFGLSWKKDFEGHNIPFFGKHDLRVVEYLLKNEIVKSVR